MNKPKLCDILGVEVNERFSYNNTECYINENGYLCENSIYADLVDSYMLCELIEHPDRIQKSKWSKDDIRYATAIKTLWGDAVYISAHASYADDGAHTFIDICKDDWTLIAQIQNADGVFSRMNYGDVACIDDILSLR